MSMLSIAYTARGFNVLKVWNETYSAVTAVIADRGHSHLLSYLPGNTVQ